MPQSNPDARAVQDDRGAATVEFAVMVIPLLILVYGIITYGYLLTFRQSISLAAAEGARSAAVAPPGISDADRTQRAIDAIDRTIGYGVDCSSAALTCTATIDPACADYGCVTVHLDYDWAAAPLIPEFGFGPAIPDHLAYETVAEVS